MAAAVPYALQIAAGAFAAYNVVKGLKEGNLMQAVLGGVSAYFAFSGLGSMTGVQAGVGQGAAGVANQAGAIAGGAELSAANLSGLSGGASTGIQNAFTQGLGNAVSTDAMTSLAGEVTTLGSEGLQFGAQGLGSGGAGAAAAGSMASAPASGSGWLSNVLDTSPKMDSNWLSSTKPAGVAEGVTESGSQVGGETLVSGDEGFLSKALGLARDNPELTKIGGQMIEGYAEGQQREDEIKRLMAEQEAARNRRGASGSYTPMFRRQS